MTCDSSLYRGVLVLAVVTFSAFVVGFPLLCATAGWPSGAHLSGQAARLLAGPLRPMGPRWRAAWLSVVRFGRKLVLAVVVASARFDDANARLPIAVFVTLLTLLLLAVLARPYRVPRDNTFEMVLITLLMAGYFVSVSEGASGGGSGQQGVLDAVFKLAVLAYWLWRLMLSWRARRAETLSQERSVRGDSLDSLDAGSGGGGGSGAGGPPLEVELGADADETRGSLHAPLLEAAARRGDV